MPSTKSVADYTQPNTSPLRYVGLSLCPYPHFVRNELWQSTSAICSLLSLVTTSRGEVSCSTGTTHKAADRRPYRFAIPALFLTAAIYLSDLLHVHLTSPTVLLRRAALVHRSQTSPLVRVEQVQQRQHSGRGITLLIYSPSLAHLFHGQNFRKVLADIFARAEVLADTSELPPFK